MLLVIEVMGIGIIFPLLPELFIAQNSPLLTATTSDVLRHFYYGLSIALWPLGMFFGTPYLGLLSDKYGRKKIFLVCLTMTALSYSLLAIAVYIHSLFLFLMTRLLSGFFAGSYEVVQAATADISTPETKARNMGWVTFATNIGFVIGPFITSMTTDSSKFCLFGITTPFWIACSLSLINAFLIAWIFTETFQPKHKITIKPKALFSSFLFVFTDARLSYLNIIFLLIISAWTGFLTTLPVYLASVFKLKISTIGLFYCLIGISCMCSILFVQPFVLKNHSLKNIVAYSSLITAIIFLFLASFIPLSLFSVLLFLCCLVELLAYSGLLALISNAVTKEEQGKTMGGAGATSSLAFMFTSLVTALLVTTHPKVPFIFSALLFFIIGGLVLRIKTTQD